MWLQSPPPSSSLEGPRDGQVPPPPAEHSRQPVLLQRLHAPRFRSEPSPDSVGPGSSQRWSSFVCQQLLNARVDGSLSGEKDVFHTSSD